MRRSVHVAATLTVGLAACGTALRPPSEANPSSTSSRPPPSVATTTVPGPTATAAASTAAAAVPTGLPDALVVNGDELLAVGPDGPEPRWRSAGAVAALDGSAAYTIEADALVRIDLATGQPAGRAPMPAAGAWRVAVVSPGGRRVVLTDGRVDREHLVATTRLTVVDTEHADRARVLELDGTIEPEALSVDGRRLFVLDHRDTSYRVRLVELATSEITDSYGRAKEPAEDMHGSAVRAVLTPDRKVLATLYDHGTGEHHPFVHILHLDHGWTYCADLPHGTYDAIARSADGTTLYVGATDGSWVTIDITAFGQPDDRPLPIVAHRGTPPVPLGSAGTALGSGVTAAADAAGVTWWRDGTIAGRVERAVDRLIALRPA